jgi:flavin-dependent dehydrogenase
MKYDLIVVGGGPGGLMAAKTAAEAGLKTILIERKKDITAPTRRTDNALSYFNFLTPEVYVEPIMVEIGTGTRQTPGNRPKTKAKLSFTVPGFSINYTGPVLLYYNFINVSPSGYKVYGMKDELWGFCFSREILLADLLSDVEKAGASVLTETLALGAQNNKDGVKVWIRGSSGEQTLEARKAIAADGNNSRIVDSLGLNKDRPIISEGKGFGCILEGVEAEAEFQDHCSWLSFNIPSIGPMGIMYGICSESGAMNMRNLQTDSKTAIDDFMKHPRFAPWFRNSRVVTKTAVYIALRPPLKETAFGNVWLAGDNSSATTGIMGAIASGYQAVRALLKELDGKEGYPEYKAWFYNAYANFTVQEHDRTRIMHRMFKKMCTDGDVDYIYKALEDRICHPAFVVFDNPEMVKDRPDLYKKIKEIAGEVDRMKLTF